MIRLDAADFRMVCTHACRQARRLPTLLSTRMVAEFKMSQQTPDIQVVHDFWEKNPLFAGEGSSAVGTLEWFREWENMLLADVYAGVGPEEIYTRGLTPRTRILDVGCGPGFWVRYFLRKGLLTLSACDLTEQAIVLVRQSLALFGLPAAVDLRTGNAEDLPYADASFEHVNCQGVIHHTPNTAKCIDEFHRVLVPGGTVCFSVYYKNFLLRNPGLLSLVVSVLSPFVSLKGRGRENMLHSGDADEIVRLYDGKENPIGKAFIRQDIEAMLGGRFEITDVRRHFFPARALPFPIPHWLHAWLHNQQGFMLVFRCVKRA